MSKKITLFLTSILIVFLSACDVDPYKGKRPVDYPNTTWNCNEGLLIMHVAEQAEDTYGYLTSNSVTKKVTFLWSKLDSNVSVLQADSEKSFLFSGTNTFGEQSFTMDISKTNGYLEDESITLLCIRE
jgi:hypothetical protein